MPCFHPVTAWKSKIPNASGKHSLVFVKDKGLACSELQIPCNGCIGCRLDRSRAWAIRIMHERQFHDLSCFLTLTYDPLHVPQDGSLDKRDFQLFMKRLRKYHAKHNGSAKIKFFHCGEYGENLERPHYHAILFGIDFADKRPHSKNKRGDSIFVSKTLDEIWGLGHCWIGQTTHESAGYVARYCLKKVTGERALEHYKRVNTETGEIYRLQPEYITCSHGIGLKFYEQYRDQLFRRDATVVRGKEAPLPKYYDRKLEAENPDLLEQIKLKRKKRALKNKENNTRERLLVREVVKQAQTSTLSRTL